MHPEIWYLKGPTCFSGQNPWSNWSSSTNIYIQFSVSVSTFSSIYSNALKDVFTQISKVNIYFSSCSWKVRWSFIVHKNISAASQQNSVTAFTSTTEVDGERNIQWLHKGRFITSSYILQLFMRMLRRCEAPEMFYSHETSPDSPLGLGWVDNAWIFPFFCELIL